MNKKRDDPDKKPDKFDRMADLVWGRLLGDRRVDVPIMAAALRRVHLTARKKRCQLCGLNEFRWG